VDLAGVDAMTRRRLVGDKAAALWEFARLMDGTGAGPPRFTIVPAVVLDRYHHTHGLPPAAVPPALPAVDTVDPAVRSWAAPFNRCGDRLLPPGPSIIRSSLVWPAAGSPRAPGVDSKAFVARDADRPTALGRVTAGLYNAYTTFCLEQARLPAAGGRRAGLIIMELVQVALEGTAYLYGGTVLIEIAPRAGRAVVSDRIAPLVDRAHVDRTTAADLVALLRPFAPSAAGALTEIEFIIDATPRIYLLQRTVHATGARDRPAVLTGVGQFEGPVLDLRGLPRNRTSAAELAGRLAGIRDRAIVVPLRDSTHLDAFTVTWLLSRRPGLPAPPALLATHDGGPQAGPNSHLRWTLRQALPDTLFVPVADRRVPPGAHGLSVSADGVTAEVAVR
jgi:hypothetical protein